MRKIIFRGRRIDNGEWIEGGYYLEPYTNYVFIVRWNSFGMGFTETIRVDPSTVCQFTGETDADGCPIFEGDMFEPYDDEFDKSVVEFRNGAFRVITYGTTGMMMPYGWDETAGGYGELDEHDLIDWVDCSVIGNIFDKPKKMDAEVQND